MDFLKEKIEINEDIRYILNTLQQYGKGYIVGGYVRDHLLGIKPNNCDFCTTVGQLYIMDIFKKYRPISIHSKLKVTQIKYKNIFYQITGMQYSESIPDDEKIYQDLERRDLTINAIAFDGEKFYANPYAFQDLENKVIRFVGNPIKTVIEDPVRIFRAIRIYAVKDFNIIEEESFKAMKKYAPLLFRVDSRRIKNEIDKMVFLENKEKAIEILAKLNLLNFEIPIAKKTTLTIKQLLLSDFKEPNIVEIALSLYPIYEKLMGEKNSLETDKEITTALKNVDCSAIIKKRVLMLLRGQYDFFRLHFRKNSLAESELRSYMKKVKYPTEIIDRVLEVLNEQEELTCILSEKKIKTLINKTNIEYFPELFSLVKEIYKIEDKGVNEKYIQLAIKKIKEISTSMINVKKIKNV